MKSRILIILLFSTLFIVTGCGGGGDNTSSYKTEKSEMAKVISGFETSVEAYDVDGMLAIINETDITETILTIQEGEFSYSKSYATLKEELEEDEAKQLTWRKESPDGQGYKLDMVLGGINYSNMSATGGYTTQTFEIYESAKEPEVARTKTDSGTIIYKMAMLTGEWQVVEMTITFNTTIAQGNSLVYSRQSSLSGGFGFGKGYTNL